MSAPAAVYRPRNPQDSDYYRCVEDYFETFIQIYDEHFSRQYGFHTFGDFLGFNPHCHILVTDGCFYGDGGMFRVAPPLELKKLEAIFRHKVFRMLLNKGKITEEMVRMLSAWKHSGFNVFCGNRISPDDIVGGLIFSNERNHVRSCRRLSSTKSARFGLLPLRGGLFCNLHPNL